MSKANDGVTYIDGGVVEGSQDTYYIGSTALDLGTVDSIPKTTNFASGLLQGLWYIDATPTTTIDDIMSIVDVDLGGKSDLKPNLGFVSDRAPNAPSGATVDGVWTYGDGKLNTNTTFNADHSGPSASGVVVWMQPRGGAHKNFNDLT